MIYILVFLLSILPPITFAETSTDSKYVVVMNEYTILFEYDLVLMSDLPEQNPEKAAPYVIYLSETGNYVVRDLDGKVQHGQFEKNKIDLSYLSKRLGNSDFKNKILSIISNESHISFPGRSMKPVAYISEDAGLTWLRREVRGLPGIIRAVTCNGKDGQYCMAVGDRYEIHQPTKFLAYRSDDGGRNWSYKVIAIHDQASGISAITCNQEDGRYCVAVGGAYSNSKHTTQPVVYTSSDRGNTWVERRPQAIGERNSYLSAISCNGYNGQYCVALGEYSAAYDTENHYNPIIFLAYTSSDAGVSWSSHIIEDHQPSASSLKSISCNGPNGENCIAVGEIGRSGKIDAQTGRVENPIKAIIYRSTNGGNDWTAYTPDVDHPSSLNSVSCEPKNGQFCMAVGSRQMQNQDVVNVAYKTVDGGLSWKTADVGLVSRAGCGSGNITFTPEKGIGLNSIACANNEMNCIAIGQAAYRIQKQNNWKKVGKEEHVYLPISFESNDGGESWNAHRTLFYNRTMCNGDVRDVMPGFMGIVVN